MAKKSKVVDDLTEIEKRADAASPGPWEYRDGNLTKAVKVYSVWRNGEEGESTIVTGLGGYDLPEENARFIAQAREDIPALIAMLREEREKSALFYDLPVGVKILHTPVLRWHMEVYDKESGDFYYHGCFDTALEMLQDYHAHPQPKKLERTPE